MVGKMDAKKVRILSCTSADHHGSERASCIFLLYWFLCPCPRRLRMRAAFPSISGYQATRVYFEVRLVTSYRIVISGKRWLFGWSGGKNRINHFGPVVLVGTYGLLDGIDYCLMFYM